jgi:hypothetical protein
MRECQERWVNDKIQYQGWLVNGELHREDGSAIISALPSGKVVVIS